MEKFSLQPIEVMNISKVTKIFIHKSRYCTNVAVNNIKFENMLRELKHSSDISDFHQKHCLQYSCLLHFHNTYFLIQSGLVYRDAVEAPHLMGLVWGEAFDWSVESTAVTAMSLQLVDASCGFSIVAVRGTIERLDRRVSNVPINEFRL